MRILLILSVVLLIGCGGTNPAGEVRESLEDSAQDGRAGRWGDYCASTTDPEACQQAVAESVAYGINPSTFFPSKDVVDRARIEVDGDRAVVDGTAAEDAVWVRREGRWIFLWKESK